MRQLHEEWFPVRYEQSFYDLATAPGSRLVTVCATDMSGVICGIVVAELVTASSCDREVC